MANPKNIKSLDRPQPCRRTRARTPKNAATPPSRRGATSKASRAAHRSRASAPPIASAAMAPFQPEPEIDDDDQADKRRASTDDETEDTTDVRQ